MSSLVSWEQKVPQQQLAEWSVNAEGASERATCFWYEIPSLALAERAKINSWRWSVTSKQLSGLQWRGEYRRRPINSGTGPSVEQECPQSNQEIDSSQLIYYPECKDDPVQEICTSPCNKTGRSISVLSLSFQSKLENKYTQVKAELPLNTTSVSYKSKVTGKILLSSCSSHRLFTRWHDWKHRLWAKSEIAIAGLMNSGQNHFRHSQH